MGLRKSGSTGSSWIWWRRITPPRTGVIVWCVTGPLNPRQKGFKDLGYYMGYRIAQAYYETHADKQAAIAAILTFRDPERFLRESGYPERMRTTTP